ncbi:MAG: tetratricopeptide repeat protein [Phycisphaerae bacterium]|nr:tetratricopeptide repeat protein [Phycisphaerae bacterium]
MTLRVRVHFVAVVLTLATALAAAQADGPATRPAGGSAPASRPARRPDGLDAARTLYMSGEYAEAAEAYKRLMDDDASRVRAAVGLAEALSAVGEYDAALDALQRVAAPAADDAGWHAARARVLETVGEYGKALAAARRANQLRPAWAPAILLRGRLLETFGQKSQALEVYETMSRVLDGAAYRTDPESLVALGRILDRHTVLSGRRASEQAANILHNYFQVAYQDIDESYWPANVAAGMFLLSKHKPKGAAVEFTLASKRNGRIADVHVGRALLHLRRWRFEACLAEVAKALKINPRHTDALLVRAMCLMKWRKFDHVPKVLQAILQINPRHVEALSLAAARHVRLGAPDEADEYIARVGEVNPRCATLPKTIGEWLSAGRQYEAAERYFKKAMDLAPEQAGPATELGLLYMQTGQEDAAREVLARAGELDDFRADVHNYVELLGKLSDYTVRETEHFVIKVDARHDAVLLEPLAEQAERIYAAVTDHFGHEPAGKTLVEVFPAHKDFSVRISGKGWIGTVGACTGPVIAMVAPDAERSRFGTYNWPTVLRHEFAHVVTLSATGNRIPHWLTEACAVWEQPDRRNYDAVRALVAAVQHDRLIPVSKLNWSFIRPKRRGDRSLAYAQSEWMLEYIITTRGYETVLSLLDGFAEGLSQRDVFTAELGVTEPEFDRAFAAWARDEIRRWGYTPDGPPALPQAKQAAEKTPQDAGAQARLAEAYWARGAKDEAMQAARAALKVSADQTAALAVLSQALAERKEYDEAARLARKLNELQPASPVAAKVLARCHLARRRWGPAIEALEQLKRRRPLADGSYKELAKLYLQLGRPERALPNLIELHRRTMTEPTYARQIAETYRTLPGEEDKALRYWREVTQINPYEASAYKAMTELYIALRRYDRAVDSAEWMTQVAADSPEAWTYLAVARYHHGRTTDDLAALDAARGAAEKALELNPSASMAARVLQQIEAELD